MVLVEWAHSVTLLILVVYFSADSVSSTDVGRRSNSLFCLELLGFFSTVNSTKSK